MKYSFFHIRFLLLISLCLYPLEAFCIFQDAPPDSVQIGNIQVVGNEKTRSYVILRELEFGEGEMVALRELELAHLRIMNLGLFNNAEFYFVENGEKRDLNIIVYERWYIFPIPIFFLNDRDWDKRSYGLGLSHMNLRGRAERLWLSGWFGYDPGFNIFYNNRWFGGNRRLYVQINMLSQSVSSKSMQFSGVDEKHRLASILFGRRFGLYWSLSVQFGYNYVGATDRSILWRAENDHDDNLSTLVSIRHDTRDLWEYPKNGSLWQAYLSRTHLLNGGESYIQYGADLREYRFLKGIVFAGRVSTALTRNRVPFYRHLYFGYTERVRGHFNRIVEGENRLSGSLEMRIPLLRERDIPLSAETWYSSYLQFLRFGLYLTFFSDAGAVWNQNETLTSDRFLNGAGFGLNAILPYSTVLRFERAYDEDGRGENIVDFQLSF
jgi:outer membrane protein assembly factor BamA